MKKKLAVFLSAAVLSILAAMGSFAAPSAEVPSLFHNDEAWYKDEMAPALFRDGEFYVPSDFIAMFDYISFTTVRNGENLLLTNSNTGDYISILYSRHAACANGKILENVSIFRENGYYYLNAEFIAENLGLFVEYSDGNKSEESSLRFYDQSHVMDFDELLGAYAGEQEETEEAEETEPMETEPEKEPGEHPTHIFLVCRDDGAEGEVLAWSIAERLGFEYTMFLTPTSEELEEIEMNDAVGLSVSSAAEAEEINDRLESLFCRRTHLVLSTGSDTEDNKLSRAGYYILKPVFAVDRTTDASVLFRQLAEYGETHDYVTVLLGNVWQSETLLLLLGQLDQEAYRIGKIHGAD